MGWITTVSRIIPLVIGAVHAVESITGSIKSTDKGKSKQDAAIDAIGAMISVLEVSSGKEMMNVPEFQNLLRKLIDDYVAIQNFIEKFKSDGTT